MSRDTSTSQNVFAYFKIFKKTDTLVFDWLTNKADFLTMYFDNYFSASIRRLPVSHVRTCHFGPISNQTYKFNYDERRAGECDLKL